MASAADSISASVWPGRGVSVIWNWPTSSLLFCDAVTSETSSFS
jgi:hypothetical protein